MSPYHNNKLGMMSLDSDDDDDGQPYTPTKKGNHLAVKPASTPKRSRNQEVHTSPVAMSLHKSSTPKRKHGHRTSMLSAQEGDATNEHTSNAAKSAALGQGDEVVFGASDMSFPFSHLGDAVFDWSEEQPSFGFANNTTAALGTRNGLGYSMPSTIQGDIWSGDSSFSGLGLAGLDSGYPSTKTSFDLGSGAIMGLSATQEGSGFNFLNQIDAKPNPQYNEAGTSQCFPPSYNQMTEALEVEAAAPIKEEEQPEDDHLSLPAEHDSEYHDSEGEKGPPSKKPKLNKDGAPRKPRQPRPKLLRWDETDWKNVALGLVWACGENGLQIPFDQASQVVSENCTAGALQQAILKLRGKQIAEGFQIPALKMAWTRKNKHAPSKNTNPKDELETTPSKLIIKKKPTRMASSQTMIITLKRAYKTSDRIHIAVPHTAEIAVRLTTVVLPTMPAFKSGAPKPTFGLYSFSNGYTAQQNPLPSNHRRSMASINSPADLQWMKQGGPFKYPPLSTPSRPLPGHHRKSSLGLETLSEVDDPIFDSPVVSNIAGIGDPTMPTPENTPHHSTSYDLASSLGNASFAPRTPPNTNAAKMEIMGGLTSSASMPQFNSNFSFVDDELIMGRDDYDTGTENDYMTDPATNINIFELD